MPRFALLSAAVTAASKLWGRHTPPLAACVGQPNGGRHPTSQTALPRPSPLQLGRYFEVEERQSGLFQELRAGIVCFLVGRSCVAAPPHHIYYCMMSALLVCGDGRDGARMTVNAAWARTGVSVAFGW